MTASPSLPKRGEKGALFARYQSKPLAEQLRWVWLIGLTFMALVTGGSWLTYQVFIVKSINGTAEIAITGMLQGMHQYIDLDLQNRDQLLKEASQLAEQSGLAPAKLANTTVVWADGHADPRGLPLSPSQLKVATAALAEHQQQDKGLMRLSEPFQDPQTGKWAIQLSRSISTEGGRLPAGGGAQGIVLSYWSSAEIETYFLQTVFLPGGKSLLVREDGRILVSASATSSGPGGSVVISELIKKPADKKDGGSSGSYFGALAGVDTIPRLYFWRKLDHYPLYLMKGVSSASVANFARPGTLVIMGLLVLVNAIVLFATGWVHLYMWQVNVTLNQRQAAEQTLRQNQERLHFALVGGSSGEWELRLPASRLVVSPRLAELLGPPWAEGGYDLAQWHALIHPEDIPLLMTALLRVIKDNDEGNGTTVRVRDSSPQGYRWLETKGRVRERDANGQIVSVIGLARDVNEQQITQAIVMDRTAQLDAIFNLSSDAFVTFDHHQKVKYVNPAFVHMTGWQDESIKGISEAHFASRLGLLCNEQRPFTGIANLRSAVLAQRGPLSELIELNSVPQRILKVSLQLSDAPTVSQILHLRDVTHETIVEGLKTEFLTTAAHELRTPMASIVGFAEILCTHPLQPVEQLEFAQIIWRQSLHLAGILDDLLDLSRIEARGGKRLLMAPLDLGALVREVVQAFPVPQGRDAPTANLPELMCKADLDKTRQVLNNVIANAYKFSGSGTSISITPAEPTVHPVSGRPLLGLVIRDTGIGMSPEQLGRVFDRFYRADKSGTLPGNGLGLSISREIMALMGGQIIIASAPQQGTTVSLMFERLEEPPRLLRFEPKPLPTTTSVA